MGDNKVLFTATEDEKIIQIVAQHPCLYDTTNANYKDQMIRDKTWNDVAVHLQRSVEDCKKRWRNIKDTYNRRKKRERNSKHPRPTKHNWALSEILKFLDKEDHKRRRNTINSTDIEDSSNADNMDLYSINDPMVIGQDFKEQNIEQHLTSPNDSQNELTNNVMGINKTVAISTTGYKSSYTPVKRMKLMNKDIVNVQPSDTRCVQQDSQANGMLYKAQCDDDVDLFFKSIAMSVKKLKPRLINEAKMKTLQMVIELENQNIVKSATSMSPAIESTSSPYVKIEDY